jgi:hypothetical protein
MQVPYIKAAIDQTAYNLSEKLKSKIEPKKIQYVSERLCDANKRLGDTFRNQSATKFLNKVGEKATADWGAMHKVQDFVLKHADKLSKGAVIGGIAAGAVALTAGIVHLVKKAHNNKQ